MDRADNCARANGATRFTSRTSRKVSTGSSIAGNSASMPALFTSTSTRPKRPSVASTSAAGASGSERSHETGKASVSSPASSSRRSCRRAASTTRAPAPSSTRANRAPSPELAPVTIATRPSRRNAARESSRGTPAAYFCPMTKGLLPRDLDETDHAAIAEFHARYGQLELTPVGVVIAAYEEEAAIGAVLDELPSEACGLPVSCIVVVDGDTDRTGPIARDHGAYVCTFPTN